jgi:mannose-1-phosphate guanylyltransferase
MGSKWAVLLAGGEGARLRGHSIAGRLIDRPKQFLRLDGGASLLGATLTRALRHVRWSNVVPLVSSAHRPWWTAELLDVPPANILAQSNSRGTAPAILLALRHILEHDHDPTILVFPSDHGIDDESTLAGTLSDAVAIAEEHRHDLVLVGARPVGIENDYGWIVPENPGSDSSRVRAFVEKPAPGRTSSLIRQGALWSTFMLVASGPALLQRYLRIAPSLVGRIWRAGWKPWTEDALNRAYAGLPDLDFSRDILQPCAHRLRVVSLPKCGWTDLGTPERLATWIDRKKSLAEDAGACLMTP